MKTVTQLFTDTLKQPSVSPVRVVGYKRRYWNGSTYVWEGSWTSLSETLVVSVSPITMQLDTQAQNEFKTANVTIVLNNLSNQWLPGNATGKFGADGASPTYGYEPLLMKFRIQTGILYTNGTQELVTSFTGVLTDLNFHAGAGTVEVTVSGESALLQNANAEAVSTTVTLENIGTGNGSNTVFTMAHNGVGIVKGIYIAGVLSRAGKDYTLSQLNDPNNPGIVTFVVAPANATAITATYIYWQQGQKFETLVASLATQAGISGGNQQITPVSYPNSITNSHTFSSADWASGVFTGAAQIDGSVIDLQTLSNGGQQGAAALTTGLSLSANCSQIGQAFSGSCPFIVTSIVIGSLSGTWTPTGTTYDIQIYADSSGEPGIVPLWSSGTLSGNGASQITVTPSVSLSTGTYWFVIALHGATRFSTIQVARFGDYPANPRQFTTSWGPLSSSLFQIASQVNMTPQTTTGTWTSAAFDSGSTPSAWLPVSTVDATNGATLSYLTASSSDNITYSSFVALPVNNVPASTLNRYLKIRASMATAGFSVTPTVSGITVSSITSSTLITLANFTGLSVHDAIQNLAALANYEFGFDAAETFFFRPKTLQAASAMSISQSDFIQDVVSTLTGNDNVYTAVRASYGAYESEVDDPGGTNTSPSARIGYALIQPSGGNLLISADADIATGVAQGFFAYYKSPRRKFKLALKFLPQLDLSDGVTLTYIDNLPSPAWYWGDPDAYWGRADLYYYGYDSQTLSGLLCKLIGSRIDTESWTCEIDFEEVI